MNDLTLNFLLEQAPRVAEQIRNAQYMGVCVVQAPGAWTRVGPTWLTESGIWYTVGAGVNSWGTTQGLAELATSTAPKPTWHAVGISASPNPNIVYACSRDVVQQNMPLVYRLLVEAEAGCCGTD